MQKILLTSAVLAVELCCVTAQADQLPLWEAGAGAAAINFPDYRGSNERQFYLLPVPYFVYRGEFLKVDRQKIRGLFFTRDWAELDMSFSASTPVKSDKNDTRRGMADLDPTFEVGPTFNMHLFKSKDNNAELDLRLPLRTVFSTDFSNLHQQGWTFEPKLNLDLHNTLFGPGWNIGLSAGPLFGTRRYHQYFFGVDSQYEKAGRPAYQAKSGYGGTQLLASVSKRFDRYWVGGFTSWTTLQGAVYEDSPLIKQKQNFSVGIAVSWVFKESSTKVEARD